MDADILARLRTAAAALDEKKAFHILALDVSAKTSIAASFLFASVGSQRQAQAAVDEVDRALVAVGCRALGVEGYAQGSWILMDYGDFLLHVFLEETREYYGIERLWGDAPDITAAVLPAR